MLRSSSIATLLLTVAVIAAFLVTISAIRWWDQESNRQLPLDAIATYVNPATGNPTIDSHNPDGAQSQQPFRFTSVAPNAAAVQATKLSPPKLPATKTDRESSLIDRPEFQLGSTSLPVRAGLARPPAKQEAKNFAFEPIPQPTSDMFSAQTKPLVNVNSSGNDFQLPLTAGATNEFNMLPKKTSAASNDFEIVPAELTDPTDRTAWLAVDKVHQTESNDFSSVQAASATADISSTSSPVNALGTTNLRGRPASLAALPTNATQMPGSHLPQVLRGAERFKLAEQPQAGEHYRDDRPITDPSAHHVGALPHDFSPDPSYEGLYYDSGSQAMVYEGKQLYAHQRPLIELGRPWYQLGQLSPGYNWFGKHNPITPQFLVYGDYRTAVASNTANDDNQSLIAHELNLDIDLKLTGTERFHAFMSPLDDGIRNTRYLLEDGDLIGELDANFDFGYFEGDLGAMVGGLVDETLPFDLPFAIGVMPLLLQNGIWMEDAFLGIAATIPARNSARLNISNMDFTFFAGYDKITSAAFPGDDSATRMYGVASFIEALNGYIEIDYAFLDDRSFDDRSYHNMGFAYTRRFGRFLSNSTRVIVNAGQSTEQVANTADGVLLLSENSLITSHPSTLVPYVNLFAGFDRPQSAARAVQAGGILRNTGILFETDGMTDYPTLDPTANDTFGGALGLNLIASDFSQQLVLETAVLGVMGNDQTRTAPGEQIGIGFRYQLPLTNAMIFRADGMYGWLNDQSDIRGLRFELRRKW